MSNALHKIERAIAAASQELSTRRDLHGSNSISYHRKRSELARLKQQRWALKCELAGMGVA